MIAGLNNHIVSHDERSEKVGQLASYMGERLRYSSEHRSWAFKFFVCECLNLANVIAQAGLTTGFDHPGAEYR